MFTLIWVMLINFYNVTMTVLRYSAIREIILLSLFYSISEFLSIKWNNEIWNAFCEYIILIKSKRPTSKAFNASLKKTLDLKKNKIKISGSCQFEAHFYCFKKKKKNGNNKKNISYFCCSLQRNIFETNIRDIKQDREYIYCANILWNFIYFKKRHFSKKKKNWTDKMVFCLSQLLPERIYQTVWAINKIKIAGLHWNCMKLFLCWIAFEYYWTSA